MSTNDDDNDTMEDRTERPEDTDLTEERQQSQSVDSKPTSVQQTETEDDEAEVDRLKDEAEMWERNHMEALQNITSVMVKLRESETELMQLVISESEQAETNEAQLQEAEELDSMRRAELVSLQSELQYLQKESDLAASEQRQLESQQKALESQANRLERRASDVTCLTGGLTDKFEQSLDIQEEAEKHLRSLEDKVLTIDDLIQKQTVALAQLRSEYAGLEEVKSIVCQTTEQELEESKRVSSTLERTLGKLQARREAALRKHRTAHGTAQVLTSNLSDLQRLKELHEKELQHEIALRKAAEEQLNSEIIDIIGSEGSDLRLGKLQEAMLLLKGSVVNLCHDHEFVGNVITTFGNEGRQGPVRGLDMGFAYIRKYVSTAHGIQRPGDRWVMLADREPTYDEISNILAALKQMVVCYDFMSITERRSINLTREIIRNSGNLRKLSNTCSEKFTEYVHERRIREEAASTDKAARIRHSLAPKKTSSVVKQLFSPREEITPIKAES